MVDFHISRTSTNQKAFFVNLSKGVFKECKWLVNDNTISNSKDTSYVFKEPGINAVKLIVIDENGKEFSKTKEVNVYHTIKKNFKEIRFGGVTPKSDSSDNKKTSPVAFKRAEKENKRNGNSSTGNYTHHSSSNDFDWDGVIVILLFAVFGVGVFNVGKFILSFLINLFGIF